MSAVLEILEISDASGKTCVAGVCNALVGETRIYFAVHLKVEDCEKRN